MYDTQASSCASSMGAPPNFPWETTDLVPLLNMRSALQKDRKKVSKVSILVVVREKKPPWGQKNLEEWIVEDDSGGSLKVKRWHIKPDDELSGCVRVGDILHLRGESFCIPVLAITHTTYPRRPTLRMARPSRRDSRPVLLRPGVLPHTSDRRRRGRVQLSPRLCRVPTSSSSRPLPRAVVGISSSCASFLTVAHYQCYHYHTFLSRTA